MAKDCCLAGTFAPNDEVNLTTFRFKILIRSQKIRVDSLKLVFRHRVAKGQGTQASSVILHFEFERLQTFGYLDRKFLNHVLQFVGMF